MGRDGLGWAHQQGREQAMAQLAEGRDCCPFTWICGGAPMWSAPGLAVQAGHPGWMGRLDFDHYPGRVFGGPQVMRLAHAKCNRSAGATIGNRLRSLGIARPRGQSHNEPGRALRARHGRWSRWT